MSLTPTLNLASLVLIAAATSPNRDAVMEPLEQIEALRLLFLKKAVGVPPRLPRAHRPPPLRV